jgi:hypothetical protein
MSGRNIFNCIKLISRYLFLNPKLSHSDKGQSQSGNKKDFEAHY